MKKGTPLQPGRRDFLKKMNLLGALTLPGTLLTAASTLDKPANNTITSFKNPVTGKAWPTLQYHNNADLSRTNGPALFNLFCRVDVPISGNLKHFQIIGSSTESHFIQAIHSTESCIFYRNHFYSLAELDEVSYEYALSHIVVTYKHKLLPFKVVKKIYLHPQYAGCIQHVSIHLGVQQRVELYYAEKAKFTLGDPYYTTYSPSISENFNGFKAANEVARNYSGHFLMSGKDVVKIWSRDDQVKYQTTTLQKAWQADEHVSRSRDDQTAVLQKKILLDPANQETNFIIYCSAGMALKEATQGVTEVLSMQAGNRFAELEKKLDTQATNYAMINTPDELLNQGFSISAKVTDQLYQTEDGLVALPGHMYPSFYPRDSHWQIRGLLALGKYEEVKSLLNHFIKYQNPDGSFPTRIGLSGKPLYHTGAPDLDSAALISLSIIEYVRWSSDIAFAEQHWKIITTSINFLKTKDVDGDGWIEQDYNQDWADRTKRHGKVNYTQCVYFRLLKDAAELGAFLKKPQAEAYRNTATLLKANYDQLFWDQEHGYYVDYVTPEGKRMQKLSQDVCLAFIFGLTENKDRIKSHLAKQKEKCWGAWGPAHHEGYQDGDKYDPVGFYCNGGVWMWLTAFEAFAHFRYGNPEDGISALNSIKEYEFGKNPYNAVYFDTTEWHDSINGLNCEHDWKQSRNFTTGSGAHVWAIVEGLFGLQRTMDGNISWQPNFPASWKKKEISINGIRQGDSSVRKDF